MKRLTSLFVVVVLGAVFSTPILAYQSVILQDDFSQDLTKWQVARNQCANSNWLINGGWLRIYINEPSACVTELVPADWNSEIVDYQLDLDMKIISGTDKNIAWRYRNSSEWIGLHIQGTTPIIQRSQVVSSSNVKPIVNGNTYHFSIIVDGTTSTISYFNTATPSDVSIIVAVDSFGIFDSGSPALQASVGADHSSRVEFDNVVVTSLDKRLPVVHQSQNDPTWSMDIYDSASNWASPTDQFINNWGCALTSASMSLQYFGAHSSPTGNPTNPSSLNEYLIHSGGYTPGGAVKWAYISNYITAGKQAGTLPNALPTLEVDVLPYSQQVVDTDYLNLTPTILRTQSSTGTHFVLGIGSYDNQVFIHDPLDLSDTFATLAAKYPTPDRAIRMRPTDGDLRGLSVYHYTTNVYPVVIADTQSTGFTPTGIVEEIPDSLAENTPGIGNPVPDPVTPSSSGHQVIYVTNASSPTYILQLSSTEPEMSESEVVALNPEGQASQVEIETLVLPSSPVVVEITPPDLSDDVQVSKMVTIDSLLSILDHFENQGLVFRSVYVRVRTNLTLANNYLERGRVEHARKAIDRAREAIATARNGFIDEPTRQYLLGDLEQLATSLQ